MIKIDKKTCVGCEACVNACPVSCIAMAEDDEGFCYPYVDETECVHCNACNSACIADKTDKLDTIKENECYACYFDDDVRLSSSSGGVFTLLAKTVIENNGIVYGACYDEQMQVVHTGIDNAQELGKLRGSKYAQSKIGDTYSKIKQNLEDGKTVLFTGTGCQVNGLKSFLGKDYPKLYTADIVCHGVPSQNMLQKYLNYRCAGNAVELNFKDKSKGWTSPQIKIDFDGSTYTKNLYLDSYSLLFSDGVTLRQSCYNCYSSALKSLSDLSLGDFWGIDEVDADMFDDKGTSLLLVKSEKGRQLLDMIKDKLVIKKASIDDALKRNPNLSVPTKLTQRRADFFNDYKSLQEPDFDKLADKYCTFYNKSSVQKLKIIVKRCLKKEY